MAEIVKKINNEMFEAIASGKKNFEVRIEDDCNFSNGDILILKEHDNKGNLTGRRLKKEINFIFRTRECNFWSKEDINKYGFTILSLR
jgi:ASC-1-like (ASCH) protein